MALSQTSLRTILAQILSIDAKYIVPKQGNWFNPQDTPVATDKPDTWLAYNIDEGVPRNLPMLLETTDETKMASVVWMIGKVELQFVGKRAEEIAQTVPHWIHRRDVKDAFASIGAELMADDAYYRVHTYYQDGLNTQLAFGVSLKVLHSTVIETTQAHWVAGDPISFFMGGD